MTPHFSLTLSVYGDKKPMDGDCSVMTYRGHRVAKTLIRAKFSPVETTGQRYIYTGCATGRVIIYDSLTGEMKRNIEGHSGLVRDVSWHPLRPEIASSSVSVVVDEEEGCGFNTDFIYPFSLTKRCT